MLVFKLHLELILPLDVHTANSNGPAALKFRWGAGGVEVRIELSCQNKTRWAAVVAINIFDKDIP